MFDQLETMVGRYEELGELLSDPQVVNDTKRFMELSREEANLRDTVATYNEYKKVLETISDSEEMLGEGGLDEDMKEMLKEELSEAKAAKEELEEKIKILLLPKDPNDDKNIILEIRGAAGGDEAALFAGDLLNMYQHYAESQGWKFEIMEASVTSIGGYKEVSALVSGTSVYSKLKYESGAHRVQRVPSTETQGRVHTSTATVLVMPEVEEFEMKIEQKDLKYRDGTPLSKEKAWNMTTNALNAVGNAVKNSSYKVATRVNLIYGDGINPFPEANNACPKDVFDLQGIDFIGVDAYKDNIKQLKEQVSSYASINGNYALVAENKGSYSNTPSLILTALALGGGYDIYDLATSNFFINNTSEPDQIDHGIYTWDLQEKDFTNPTRMIIKGLTDANVDVATVKPENFAAFNISDNHPIAVKQQQIRTTNVEITFSTNNASLAFALDKGSYLLVYSTGDSEFHFGNGTFEKVIYGKYNDKGTFVEEGNTVLNNQTLHAKGGVFYKVTYSSQQPLISNTIENIGNNL